jgi:hypothetical protein
MLLVGVVAIIYVSPLRHSNGGSTVKLTNFDDYEFSWTLKSHTNFDMDFSIID